MVVGSSLMGRRHAVGVQGDRQARARPRARDGCFSRRGGRHILWRRRGLDRTHRCSADEHLYGCLRRPSAATSPASPSNRTTAVSRVRAMRRCGRPSSRSVSRFPSPCRWPRFRQLPMGEPDILNVMILIGIGVPAFGLLVLAAWSSNVLSLYSGSLAMATIFRGAGLTAIIAAFGVVGTALALTRVDEYLVAYLILLGITIPPVSSIYAVETLLFRSPVRRGGQKGTTTGRISSHARLATRHRRRLPGAPGNLLPDQRGSA